MATQADSLPTRIPSGNSTGIHLVECAYGRVRYWREADLTDRQSVISGLMQNQFEDAIRIVAFDPVEGWCRDVSQDIAQALTEIANRDGADLPYEASKFVGRHLLNRYAA